MNQFQLLGRAKPICIHRFPENHREEHSDWRDWGTFPKRKEAETVMGGHSVNYPLHEFKVVPKCLSMPTG